MWPQFNFFFINLNKLTSHRNEFLICGNLFCSLLVACATIPACVFLPLCLCSPCLLLWTLIEPHPSPCQFLWLLISSLLLLCIYSPCVSLVLCLLLIVRVAVSACVLWLLFPCFGLWFVSVYFIKQPTLRSLPLPISFSIFMHIYHQTCL